MRLRNKKNTPPRVRSEVLKSLYVAMLLHFPLEWVVEFWSQHPYPCDEGNAEGSRLFECLWTEKKLLPIAYVTSVFNSLEPFLVARQRCVLDFLEFYYVGINSGIFIPAKFALGILNPFLGRFFSSRDLRYYLLSLSHHIASKVFPGLKLSTVSVDSHPDWRQVIRAVDVRLTEFPNSPILDLHLYYGESLKHYPLVLSLPSFEDVSALADCRLPQQIAPEVQIKGREVEFHAFCLEAGLDPVKVGWPNTRVWLAEEDYLCPLRQRTVLRRGCVYGAPVFLLKLRFLKNIQRPPNFLKNFVASVLDSEESPQIKAEKLHRKLIRETDRNLDVVFHSQDIRITVNGRHLVSSAPARILERLIKEHLATGRSEFQHLEFIHDESVISHQSNPNFIIRLNRLEKTLAKKCPDIKIAKSGRGLISFKCRRKMTFREI